jgi:hypothetical protein
MADGHPIGRVYVELDLDPTRYTKGQQELLKSATSTSLNIEDNFKKLNIKSDAVYDLMKQKAINSFEMIANSAKSTANDIVRAEEAKAQALSQIQTQQYGKHASLLDNLKQNYIAASALIVGAWLAVNKAISIMDEGAKSLQIGSSFKIVAEEMGADSEHMIESMNNLTKHTIDDSDLMQKATKLMLAGYDPAQIEKFGFRIIYADI